MKYDVPYPPVYIVTRPKNIVKDFLSNEKQKATMRAVLCFLYQKCGRVDDARRMASSLPHTRESREVIEPIIAINPPADVLTEQIRLLLLGE